MNRRRFLSISASVATGLACRNLALGQLPQKFKIGMAATTWLTQHGTTPTYWKALAAMGTLGIGLTEADNSGAHLDTSYGNDPAAFRRLSRLAGVRLAGMYQSLLLHEADLSPMLKQIRADGRFLHAVDAKYVALGWDAPAPIGGKPYQRTPQDLRRAIAAANQVGRLLSEEYGLLMAYHAERDTPKETAEALLDGTDPRVVHFCADVGHLAAMGLDPVATVRKYSSRLVVSHWKDFAPTLPPPSYLGEGFQGDFIELGHGVVDFKALSDLYRQIGFAGWVMLELDRPSQPNLETSAREMQAYVTDVLHLQVVPRAG